MLGWVGAPSEEILTFAFHEGSHALGYLILDGGFASCSIALNGGAARTRPHPISVHPLNMEAEARIAAECSK